jgi:hypothetical protein
MHYLSRSDQHGVNMVFPTWDILSSLSRELTWTHFRTLIYLSQPLQREFYAEMARAQHWSVRELQRQIEGMLKDCRQCKLSLARCLVRNDIVA